jgi:uncharacterized membrane protein
MASLGQAKTLGGVGAILALIGGFLGGPGGIVAIIGLILILIAVKYVSDVLGDPKIFNNMIIAVVLAIIGIVALIVIVLSAVYSFIGFGSLSSFRYTAGTAPPANIVSLLATVIVGLVVAWIFFLVSSIFLKRSYETIGNRLNVGMFRTTGLLYLIGAALTIILVGVFIVFIAEILQIVAFFSIPEQMPTGPQPMPGQMGPPPATMVTNRRR